MTSTSSPLRNRLLFASTYAFPVVAFPLVTYGWWRSSGGSWRFVAVVMGVPVLFGYLMPWIRRHERSFGSDACDEAASTSMSGSAGLQPCHKRST